MREELFPQNKNQNLTENKKMNRRDFNLGGLIALFCNGMGGLRGAISSLSTPFTSLVCLEDELDFSTPKDFTRGLCTTGPPTLWR